MSGRERRQFDHDGYLIVERYLPPERLERIRAAVEDLYAREGPRGGWEQAGKHPHVRRLCNLFVKGDVFVELALDPLALAYAEHVIGRPFRWQGMNAHDPRPGEDAYQPLHADRQHWKSCRAYFNVLWVLDDLTERNGATRVVPGSHRRPWPKDALDDPLAAAPDQVLVECPAGSAVLLHGDTWHGARSNRTQSTRRVLHMGFASADTETQYDIAATLPAAVRQRLGAFADRLLQP